MRPVPMPQRHICLNSFLNRSFVGAEDSREQKVSSIRSLVIHREKMAQLPSAKRRPDILIADCYRTFK